jgi:epoxyqueuosine reductase
VAQEPATIAVQVKAQAHPAHGVAAVAVQAKAQAYPAQDLATIAVQAKAQAHALGFSLVGIAELGPMESAPLFDEWLAAGMHGEMEYMQRGAEKRRDSRLPHPGAVSAIVVAMEYGGREPSGPVARYARGDDYHDVMTARLRELHRWLDERVGRPVAGKAYVDTGPILERELAQRAGLGWIGKSTNLVNPRIGSFFFIGSLLVELPLPADEPFVADHCGTCTRCLDACPTGAFVEPRKLDARKCISYLTIEQKGAIPRELRPLIGNRVYGCDICQEVCPWNGPKFVQITDEDAFRPREGVHGAELIELMGMDQAEFSRRFKGSPVKRAKRRGFLRNVAVALGNWGAPEAVPVLAKALEDEEPLVRGHAAWALGRIGTAKALEALASRLSSESEESVELELIEALGL